MVIEQLTVQNRHMKMVFKRLERNRRRHHQAPAQSSSLSAIASNSATGTVQHCRFWRIQRTTKEKEKFPDRINLDRRGLATLPLIVDEPNLRLLSL